MKLELLLKRYFEMDKLPAKEETKPTTAEPPALVPSSRAAKKEQKQPPVAPAALVDPTAARNDEDWGYAN